TTATAGAGHGHRLGLAVGGATVVGHRFRDAVGAGAGIGVAGVGRGRGTAVAEGPCMRSDRAVAVGGGVGEAHRQAVDRVGEVGHGRIVAATATAADVAGRTADDQLAAAGGQVIARAGALATVVARGDVVEVRSRQLVQQ